MFTDEVNEAGIQRRLTTAHTPQQNGVAEPINRTPVEVVVSMLSHKNLAKQYWAEALAAAVYIQNRVTSRALPSNLTQHHLRHGKVPTIEHLRLSACRCWYTMPKWKRKKLGRKGSEEVMIGYADHSKANKLWDVNEQNFVISRDVTFDELYTAPAIVGVDRSDDTAGSDCVVILENASCASTNNGAQPTKAIRLDDLEKVECVTDSIPLSSSASQEGSNHAPSSECSSTSGRGEPSESQGTLALVATISEL